MKYICFKLIKRGRAREGEAAVVRVVRSLASNFVSRPLDLT
jgi:hypothetical protein